VPKVFVDALAVNMKQMQHDFASLPGMTIPLIVQQIVTEQRVANACMDPDAVPATDARRLHGSAGGQRHVRAFGDEKT
jgi:hypothetical protein